jgi:acyl-CoA thioester hydrolase
MHWPFNRVLFVLNEPKTEHMKDLTSQYPVVLSQDLVWGDMDAFEHINNTVYFRYFEDIRIEYFKRIKVLEHMNKTQIGPILASARCDFRAPLTFPDTIQIATVVTGIEPKRFKMQFIVYSENLQRLAAEGEGLVVYYDYRQGKSCAIPDAILSAINDLQSDDT